MDTTGCAKSYGATYCGKPATRHFLGTVQDAIGQAVNLIACAEHEDEARRTLVEIIAEHPFEGPCGSDPRMWLTDLNVCVEITERGIDVTALQERMANRGG